MDLIDRYVNAVTDRLQPARRPKVAAELRAAILDALDARESTAASEADVVAVLVDLGDPERMAAEYEPARQYLIGPELYPHFMRGLRIALLTTGVASVVVFCAALPMSGLAGYLAGELLMRVLMQAALGAVVSAGVLLAVFIWLQRTEVRVPRTVWSGAREPWDPRSMPRAPAPNAPSHFASVTGLVVAAIALMMVGVIGEVARQAAPHAPAALRLLIPDVVSRNVLLLQVASFLVVIANAATLLLRRWHKWTRGVRLLADIIALFVFVAFPLQLVGSRTALIESGASVNFVNWLVINAFIVVLVVVALIIHYWWRVVRSRSTRVAGAFAAPSVLVACIMMLTPLVQGCIAQQGANAATLTTAKETRGGPQAVVSPEVDGEGRITFRILAVEARQVVLAVEGMAPVLMTREASGVWRYTSKPMPPELYLYSFVVDDSLTHDPANPMVVPTLTARRESLVHVPGRQAELWEPNGAPAGALTRASYTSARFHESRDLWVYTPPGYAAAQGRRYPVLYLLHGVNSDARAWGTAGRANVILDNLLAAHAAEPMIVVMPLGYGFPDPASRSRHMLSPATDQLAVSHEFGASIIEEVLPLVDREYRTRTERASRAIAGFSMGGSQALHIGLTHRETFGAVASFGGALIMYGGRYAEWFGAHNASGGDAKQSLHLSVGTEDFLLGVNRHFADWLNAHGTTARLEEVPGGHTWPVWRRELIRLAPQLFRARSAQTPNDTENAK